MKVELESPLKEALLKGCQWMGENEGSSEGGQDEDTQLPTLRQLCSIAKTYSEERFSKFYYS